jgi:hypothetical protein
VFALGGGYRFWGSCSLRSMRVGVRLIAVVGLLGVGLAAGAQSSTVITEPAAPLLPGHFGEWKTAAAGAETPASVVSLVSANKTALEECGPERSQVADYARSGKTLHVEAIQFKDRTGAFSAYTLMKRMDMTPLKGLGADAAAGDGAALFTVGTSLVVAYPMTAAEAGALKPLADGMPKAVGTSGLAPLLPSLAPAKGLVEGSLRYALGSSTYAAEGGVLPASQMGWDKEAEAITADYKDKRGEETLTILMYPTPTIAGTMARMVQGMVASGGAKFGTAKVRREGELVMLASGTFPADEAQKMVENIHLKQMVSLDNAIPPTEHVQVMQTYSLLMNIAILAGVLMTAAVLLGLFLGGGRALYRVARGKPAATEPEFLSLHLEPQSKPVRFDS